MKNKTFQTLLYSTIGVVAMALALIALNVIGSSVKHRFDLTKEKAYTLSDGTKAILRKLDAPVKIRLYYTQGDTSGDGQFLKGYAKQVKDLLTEYKQVAKGKLTIEEYDPQPDSDAEDSARLDGIDPKMLRSGEQFYLGLCVEMFGEKEAIPFLDPNRERLLEYDLSRAITRVGVTEKPVVGVMTPLPVFGMGANPMMMQMGRGGQDPWGLITELKRDYTVKRIGMDAEKIDDDVKVLMVIHPRDITDKAQYAIDQFVLRGGKLMAFLDPLPAIIDAREQQGFGSLPNSGSTLDKLLKAWGLSLDVGKVVADTKFMLPVGGPNQRAPAILGLTGEGLNDKDILTAQIDSVWLPFAGAFTGTPAEGLTETVLLKSSPDSQFVEGFMASLSGENILKDFKPSGNRYAMAVRLTGKFKTAFPNGKPEDKKDEDKDKKDADKKPEEKKPDDSLKQSAQDNSVILVADADFLGDGVAVERVQTVFGTALVQRNGNLAFAQNAIEQLTGDSNLITVRSRATLDYPLTKIQDMEAEAVKASQSEINQMEEKVRQAQQKINELQQAKKDKDQRFVLSPEQEAELVKLRKDEADTNKRLKLLKKETRKKIVARENWHKWMDTLAVPAAVAFSGIMMAVVKGRRTSAK